MILILRFIILTGTFISTISASIAGHALSFDRNDHLEVFVPSSQSLDISDASITIECWIYFPDPGDGPISIIAAKGGAAQSGSWKIRVNAEGLFQVRFMINGQGSGWFGTGGIEANTWTHVAATYDGQEILTYVNGELQSTTDFQGNIDASDEPLRFGRRDNNVANFFQGLLDEFRLWDNVRSSEEISNTMNVLVSGNSENLVGYWRFDEGERQIVNDQTENENNGWLGQNEDEDARDPEWVESEAPIYGGILTFSADAIEFGPVIAEHENIRSILFANLSEEDDELHAIEYTLQDDGNDPDWLVIDPAEGTIEVGDTVQVNFSLAADNSFIVAVSPIPPIVFEDEDGFTGFEIDLWEAIAERLEVTYRYVEVPFEGILDSLQSGFADLAIAGITINASRERRIDFSHPTLESGLRIMVRADDRASMKSQLKESFSPGIRRGLWYLLLFIILCGHILWWSEKGKDAINDHYFPGIFEAFWLVTTTMTTVGYGDIAPRQWFGRIAAFMVMMTGIGLFGWLIGEFSAVTTANKFRHSIETPRDLRGKTVATVTATTSVSALEMLGAKITVTADIEAAYELLHAGSVQAVVFDSPVLMHFVKNQNMDKFSLTGEVFHRQDYGFAFHEGSQLREAVNRELLSLKENLPQPVSYRGLSQRWFGVE